MKSLLLGASLSAMLAATAFAQDLPAPSATDQAAAEAPAAPATAPKPVVAVAGTFITIELTQDVTSKTAKKGDKFAFRLAEPVKVDGQVVIPAGVAGVGEVIDASHAGLGGRPGELLLAVRYLEVDGRKVTLRGFKLGNVGRDNLAVSGVATIAVGVIGLLIQGGDVTYPKGLLATAKLNEDVVLVNPAADNGSTEQAPAPTAPASPTN